MKISTREQRCRQRAGLPCQIFGDFDDFTHACLFTSFLQHRFLCLDWPRQASHFNGLNFSTTSLPLPCIEEKDIAIFDYEYTSAISKSINGHGGRCLLGFTPFHSLYLKIILYKVPYVLAQQPYQRRPACKARWPRYYFASSLFATGQCPTLNDIDLLYRCIKDRYRRASLLNDR